MKDIDSLIFQFLEEAERYSKAILEGNNKVANKANEKMMSIIKAIEGLKGTNRLLEYLDSDNDGIRLCVALNIIKTYPDRAKKTLQEIIIKDNLFSLLAKMGLDLRKNGEI